MADRVLAEPAPRRAPRPGPPGTGVLPEPDVCGAGGISWLRAGRPGGRRLHRVAARAVADDQRLRDQDRPPDVRRRRVEPAAPATLERAWTPGTVGGPPRSLRRVPGLRAGARGVDQRVLATPGPGAR